MEANPGGGRGHRPKNLAGYLRANAILAGGCRGPMLLEDLNYVIAIMIRTGRTVPANAVVDWMVERDRVAALDGLC